MVLAILWYQSARRGRTPSRVHHRLGPRALSRALLLGTAWANTRWGRARGTLGLPSAVDQYQSMMDIRTCVVHPSVRENPSPLQTCMPWCGAPLTGADPEPGSQPQAGKALPGVPNAALAQGGVGRRDEDRTRSVRRPGGSDMLMRVGWANCHERAGMDNEL